MSERERGRLPHSVRHGSQLGEHPTDHGLRLGGHPYDVIRHADNADTSGRVRGHEVGVLRRAGEVQSARAG